MNRLSINIEVELYNQILQMQVKQIIEDAKSISLNKLYKEALEMLQHTVTHDLPQRPNIKEPKKLYRNKNKVDKTVQISLSLTDDENEFLRNYTHFRKQQEAQITITDVFKEALQQYIRFY